MFELLFVEMLAAWDRDLSRDICGIMFELLYVEMLATHGMGTLAETSVG